jgi:hypothetical protein
MTAYKIIPYNASGVKQAEITDFTGLSVALRVNAPGMTIFSVRGDHPVLDDIADRWKFEVWRRADGQDWRREHIGVYRYGRWLHSDQSRFVAYCPGIMSFLGRRIVGYKAGTADRSLFSAVAAETIMKTLVTYNITSSATTANNRVRNGDAWPATQITVGTDRGEGEILTLGLAWKNLLEALQDIAPVAGGDFDLVQTSPTAYEFRWYTGQLGTDRTATVKFSLGLGNMALPVYEDNRLEEATVCIVGGPGEVDERTIVVRTGTDYSATNDIETFLDASDMSTTAGQNARGDAKLEKVKAEKSFSFQAVQTPARRYAEHYYLGDLVTAVNPFTGDSYTMKVKAVRLGFDSDEGQVGAEQIETEIGLP